jgi:hypothetical protein
VLLLLLSQTWLVLKACLPMLRLLLLPLLLLCLGVQMSWLCASSPSPAWLLSAQVLQQLLFLLLCFLQQQQTAASHASWLYPLQQS